MNVNSCDSATMIEISTDGDCMIALDNWITFIIIDPCERDRVTKGRKL